MYSHQTHLFYLDVKKAGAECAAALGFDHSIIYNKDKVDMVSGTVLGMVHNKDKVDSMV
ncbi:hypothetical protein ACQCT3_04710 [Sutcliffiella horikoshii]